MTGTSTVPVTVVIPVRDGEDFVAQCLRSVVASAPAQIIVVDGSSTDGTLAIVDEIVRGLEGAEDRTSTRVQVLEDNGTGVAEARMLGVRHAEQDVVALVDVDVVLGEDDLVAWYAEFRDGGFTGLQAGLRSESMGEGYWGRSLATHHVHSRSKNWFGLSATMFEREILLRHGLDGRFSSGEDIEFRHRLARLRLRIGVSRRVVVRHRFRDTWKEARHQWREDGEGLARVVRKNGLRDAYVMAIPAAATLRGVILTGLRRPRMLPYWACFLLFNYTAMVRMLVDPNALAGRTRSRGDDPHELGLTANSGALTVTRVLPMVVGFGSWTLAARFFEASSVGLAAAAVSAAALVSQLSVAGHGQALVQLLPKESDEGRRLVVVGAFIAVVTGFGLSWLLALAASTFTPQLEAVVSGRAAFWLFVTLGTASAAAFYYDHVAVARRRSHLAVVRSAIQSGSLLAAVFAGWLVGDAGDGLAFLVTGAAVGVVLSTLAGIAQEMRRRRVDRSGVSGGELRRLAGSGVPNLIVTVAHRAPMFSLPFLITELLSPATNAAWYVAWMMAMAAWFVPNSVGYSLQARLARPGLSSSEVHVELVGALRSGAMLAVVAVVGVAAVGPLLLWIMGPVYSDATVALWVLSLAVLPTVFSEPWLAVCRVRKRWTRPIVTYVLVGSAVLTGAYELAGHGIEWVAVIWLAAQVVVGLVAWWSLRGELRAPATHPSRLARLPS